MWNIPDDPIIACMERTGYPPWFFRDGRLIEDDDDEYEEDEFEDEDEEELDEEEEEDQAC